MDGGQDRVRLPVTMRPVDDGRADALPNRYRDGQLVSGTLVSTLRQTKARMILLASCRQFVRRGSEESIPAMPRVTEFRLEAASGIVQHRRSCSDPCPIRFRATAASTLRSSHTSDLFSLGLKPSSIAFENPPACQNAKRLERVLERFFFDVDDGKRRVHDEVGRCLIDLDVAVLEAGILLRSLAVIRTIEGRPGTTYVTVRDAHGEKVHEVSTTLS